MSSLHLWHKNSIFKREITRLPPNQSPIPQISITPTILKHHQNVELHVEYFCVNRLPYLLKKLSNINFLTVQTGKNKTKNNIETGLVHVIKTYEARGFKVTAVHGDNLFEFDYVNKAIKKPAIIHIKVRKEYDGIVERPMCTIKESGRSTCHHVPYRNYTKPMTNYLVEGAVYWINVLPSNNGVSNTVGLAGIFLGRPQP